MRCLIIGGSGGIGRALCERIASDGGTAHLIGRTESALSEVASRHGFSFDTVDANDWDALELAVARGTERMHGLDAAINLAGSVLLKPIHLTTRKEWDACVADNLGTAVGMLRSVIPRMSSTGGSILLMSSSAATIGMPNHEAIAACKSGIEGLVRSAAATYAPRQIRVNGVAPGLTQTPLTERIWKNPRSAEASLAMHPLGRFGTTHDIAEAIYWLASPAASWITGQVLGVDGGLARLKSPPMRPATPS